MWHTVESFCTSSNSAATSIAAPLGGMRVNFICRLPHGILLSLPDNSPVILLLERNIMRVKCFSQEQNTVNPT